MSRMAGGLAWATGLGFGPLGVYGTIYFAKRGEVWQFAGFPTYGEGPSSASVSTPPSRSSLASSRSASLNSWSARCCGPTSPVHAGSRSVSCRPNLATGSALLCLAASSWASCERLPLSPTNRFVDDREPRTGVRPHRLRLPLRRPMPRRRSIGRDVVGRLRFDDRQL